MPCRINRRRLWTGRILLEATQHEFSSFLTLTYKPESCPDELVPADLRNFWKRLRNIFPAPIRYFAVGEYGEVSFRPHFHAIVFGLPFTASEFVSKAWSDGFFFLGDCTPASVAYCTGYVSKKMTHVDDPRLEGRHPEFARMSLRPGIGHSAAVAFDAGLTSRGGSSALVKTADVPSEIRIGSSRYPLGRYLRNAMREAIGWQQGVPEIVRRQAAFEKSLETMEVVTRNEKRRRASEVSALARAKINSTGRHL